MTEASNMTLAFEMFCDVGIRDFRNTVRGEWTSLGIPVSKPHYHGRQILAGTAWVARHKKPLVQSMLKRGILRYLMITER